MVDLWEIVLNKIIASRMHQLRRENINLWFEN